MSITKKLFLITTIMAVLITSELALLTLAIKGLSAARAYISGESLWSKSQKNAVYYLIKYLHTRDEDDYLRFRDFLKIPLSDHQALLVLTQTPLDYKAAQRAFLGGGVHPDDIDGVIWLFHRFHNFYYLNTARNYWMQGDELLFDLIKQSDILHQAILTHKAKPLDIEQQLEKIDKLNHELTEIENKFSSTLSEGSRWLENIIFKLLLTVAILVEVTGILLNTLIGIKISKNIKEMNKIASKVGQADFSQRVNISSTDEIGQLATSFNRMIDELDKQDKLKSEFISVLSHELRTPLTSIKGSLDLLTSSMLNNLTTEGAQNLINIAKNNCGRLSRLIDDLLDIEKIESGQMNFLFKPILLNELLNEAITANQPYGEHFHVTLVLVSQQEGIIVNADYDRLIQVLSNLISNAIKFSPAGSKIIVSSEIQNNQVQVAVTDHGLGIPEAFQSKIFQKFAQADSTATREHGGTGLGLNISKTIIEKHGGTIFFKTQANKGSTFYFNLPMIIE